ncbi:UBP1-associated protein 2C [Phytophthora cinnamomi]|uniref:UBP1-associated protein 2C n=1 Tax=Phytophthora cinnamomi TaxID=4785 RepID=UPI00355AACCF|nr:UBP1-associated protein 2C [Phytophthora cinnamomi]
MKRKLEERDAGTEDEEDSSSSSEAEQMQLDVRHDAAASSESEEEPQQQKESEEEEESEEGSEDEAEEVELESQSEAEEEEEEKEVEKVEKMSSSSDSEEDAVPAVQSKQQSSDSCDSEQEDEDEEEEEEEGATLVVQKQEESMESSDSDGEETQMATSVLQSSQDGSDSSDSSDSEDSDEEQEDQPKKKFIEKRKPVKVLAPVDEGPPKKKARIEKVQRNTMDDRVEELRRILEPLSREQLVETMANAAAKYDHLFADLKVAGEYALSLRKVVVHGLALETKTDKLKLRFGTFGKIEDAAIICDESSGKSQGVGYVTFIDEKAAQRAVQKLKRPIKVDDREVSCRLATIRDSAKNYQPPTAVLPLQTAAPQQLREVPQASKSGDDDRKLIIRLLAKKTTRDALRKAFEKFGAVENAHVVRDKGTGDSKCFGFVTFREEEGANNALKTPTIKLDGNTIVYALAAESKRIVPSEAPDRTLYVASLSKKTTRDTLRKEFGKFGDVESAYVKWNRETNESKGCGYVKFREKTGADSALKAPTIKIDGNDIVLVIASTQKKHRTSDDLARSLFVGNISKSKTTANTLRETFEQFGDVESTIVVRDKNTDESKGFGFVTFREKAGVDNAMKTPTIMLHGNKLVYRPKTERPPKNQKTG